jgi:NifU-like protein involved in Fe-S cluster formation
MSRLPAALEHFFRQPRHAGALADPSTRGEGRNAACGDHLVLELRVVAGRIERAGYQARGCSGVIAVADLLCEHLSGLEPAAALAFDLSAAVERAGGLPPTRRHALQVCRRALEQAVASIR